MLLILQKALPLNASQALLPWEGESYKGRGSPFAGQGLQVVPLELKNLTAPLVWKVQAAQGRKPAKDRPGIRGWRWLADQAKENQLWDTAIRRYRIDAYSPAVLF